MSFRNPLHRKALENGTTGSWVGRGKYSWLSDLPGCPPPIHAFLDFHPGWLSKPTDGTQPRAPLHTGVREKESLDIPASLGSFFLPARHLLTQPLLPVPGPADATST